jgi:hypothetical protein
MQNLSSSSSESDADAKLKQQIDLLLGDTDMFEPTDQNDKNNNKQGSSSSNNNNNDSSSRPSQIPSRPARPDTKSSILPTTNRRLNPLENVPLLGMKGYNRDVLGFVLVDGEIMEWRLIQFVHVRSGSSLIISLRSVLLPHAQKKRAFLAAICGMSAIVPRMAVPL